MSLLSPKRDPRRWWRRLRLGTRSATWILCSNKSCVDGTTNCSDDLALWDPDEAANYDVDVVVERLREVRKQDADWFDGAWDAIREELRAVVSSDTPAEETVVVPWEHLFVEALVGHHPLLETFKLRHREIDAEKAKAEVRELDLENIRRSALLLSGENLDPQIDKRITIDGSGVVPVAPTDSG